MNLPQPCSSLAGPDPSRELVLLVHGLAAHRTVLRPLELRLRARGYQTHNWGYPSIRGDILALSGRLGECLGHLEQDHRWDRFHLVTHSMGSILARTVLVEQAFSRLGRIVMLCPPHRGSRAATRLAKLLGSVCKPLHQLSDRSDSFVNQLPEPTGLEIGIIAAARDRVVRLESTRLDMQADHLVVDSGHTSLLFRRDLAEYVARFIRRGQFCSGSLPTDNRFSPT